MKSLTVIIPAKNEKDSLQQVVVQTLQILLKENPLNKIIIVDDGSEDETAEIAKKLKTEFHSQIDFIIHPQTLGVGAAYKSALAKVETDFVTWLPADGEIQPQSIQKALQSLATDCIVVTYPLKSFGIRPIHRVLISYFFQRGMNFLFMNRIRYFNGNSIYPTSWTKNIKINSNGFFFNVEILVKILCRYNPKYQQVPYFLIQRFHGKSKALRFKNLISVISDCIRLRIETLR